MQNVPVLPTEPPPTPPKVRRFPWDGLIWLAVTVVAIVAIAMWMR